MRRDRAIRGHVALLKGLGVPVRDARAAVGPEPGLSSDDGLGVVGEVVDAAVDVAAQVLTAGISAITKAVHKVRDRRRAYKKKMQPIEPEDVGRIVGIAALEHASFQDALPRIQELIAEIRPGRTGFIVIPGRDDYPRKGVKKGSEVNELQVFHDTFKEVRKRVKQEEKVARHQQAQVVAGSRGKKEAVVTGVAVLLAIGLLVGVYKATRGA